MAAFAAGCLVGVVAQIGRAAAPDGRYAVTAETALDKKTGLTWQRVPPPARYVLADARSYCAALTTPPGLGWRLPTVKELATLLDLTAQQPVYLDTTTFSVPDDISMNMYVVFWSSTPFVGTPPTDWADRSGGWLVYFKSGLTYYATTNVGAFVRCVR